MKKQEFIEKIKSKGNNPEEFDFSLLPEEFSTKSYQYPICKIHGKFDKPIRIDSFLFNYKCPKCSRNNYSNKNKLKQTNEEFIEECKKKHINPDGTPKYDYSITKFLGSKNNIEFICHKKDKFGNEHGIQTARADMHKLGKCGCKICANNSSGEYHKITFKEFLTLCKTNNIDIDKYDFSKTIWNGYKERIIFTCKKHKNEINCLPINLLQGVNVCKFCNTSNKSNKENELLEYIKSKYNGKIETNVRYLLDGKEIDIYLPEKKLGFEFNGLFWHSEIEVSNDACIKKQELAESKGIHLIQIFEDDWSEKRLIIQSRINQLLNITEQKIYARKCILKPINSDLEKVFLIKNHLQEYTISTVCYGLFFNNELVACMSFGPLRKNLGNINNEKGIFELYRFANKKNTVIIGGASKLFNYFIKRFKPKQIISYADRCWSINNEHNLYQKLNFKFVSYTIPNYSIIIGKTRNNRYNFRKSELIRKYNCPPEKTEHQFCLEQGWYRIYDCGNLKYVWLSNQPNK